MTSKLTRERIEQYANDPRMCNINDEIRELARIALAAMDSEPVVYSDFENFWSAYIHPLAQDDELKDFAWDVWNACRAAMLQAGNSPAHSGLRPAQNIASPAQDQGWIPVSERLPVDFEAVIAFDGDQVYGEAMYSLDDGFTVDGYDPCDRLKLQSVTHWMPLPAAPQQEVKGE